MFSPPPLSKNFDVIIIGGGLAGLSAAIRLASEGVNIGLYEQAPRLGGRCYSYIDKQTGDVVDNGQHVLIGAYHHLLHYLDLIGTKHLLKTGTSLSLTFHHPRKGRAKFEVASLPKPFHLTAGMLKFKLLSFSDRQRLLKVGLELNRWNKRLEEKLSSLTVNRWLIRLNQSEESRQSLWHPIAISIMNEIPERASALTFARSLRAAFFGKKSDSAIYIPTVGQSELYVSNALQRLKENDSKVFLNTEVESLLVDDEKCVGIRLSNGMTAKSKYVISCVPHFTLSDLIPMRFKNEQPFIHLNKFKSSPIISFHLWFDKNFMDVDYLGLIGKPLQWIFDKRKIMEESKSTGYITAVISGAHEYISMPKEKLLAIALRDIHDTFPESRRSKLIQSLIIKEKRATFSSTPESEVLRPLPETPIKNLYLAGDWTDTGFPATIEGAVISGFKAASIVSN